MTQPATTVAANGTATFTIRFDPSVLGLRQATATLAVINDLNHEPSVSFDLEGITPGTVTITATKPEVFYPVGIFAAESEYAVTYTVTRTDDDTTEALDVTVNLTQDKTYLDTAQRSQTVTILANEASADLTFTGSQLQLPDDEVLENGTLTATVTPPAGYGTGPAASVDIVVFMTVRIEELSYTVDEGAGLPIRIIARTGDGATRPTDPASVLLTSGSATADPDDDYVRLNKIVEFEPGDFADVGAAWQAEKTISVMIVDDTEIENDETFNITMTTGIGAQDPLILFVNAAGAMEQGIQVLPVTIIDDDRPEVTITADAPSVTYLTGPGSQDVNATFTVTRTGDTTAALDVMVILDQADKLILAPGELSQTVTIEAGDASAKLTFTGSQFWRSPGAVVAGGALTATVQPLLSTAAPAESYDVGAADVAMVDIVVFMTVRFEQSSYTVDEDAETLAVKLIARTDDGAARPDGSVTTYTVAVATVAGTAVDTAGDFSVDTASIRRVTFAPDNFTADGAAWQAEKTVSVMILDDMVDENDEEFRITLTTTGLASQARILPVDSDRQNPGPQEVTVTITDNDNPEVTITANVPRVSIQGYDVPRVSYPGYFDPTFTVTRATDLTTAPLDVTVELTQDEDGGTYLPNAPLMQTVTIPAGELIGEFSVSQSQFQPPGDEPLVTGTLTATVQSGTGYDVGAASASASVDIVPFMTVRIEEPSYTVDEGARTLEVRIIARTGEGAAWPPLHSTNSNLTAFEILESFSVGLFTASDTADSDQDYTVINEIVPFLRTDFKRDGGAWEREETVTVTILDDDANDDGEMFNLVLDDGGSGLGSLGSLDPRIKLVDSDGTTSGLKIATVTITDNDAAPVVMLPGDALVGNTGQTGNSGSRLVGSVRGSPQKYTQAQRFTTGSDTRGYTLTAIDVLVDDFRTESRPRVSIHEVASGNPGNRLFNLVNPATFSDNAVNTFIAPGGERYLAPGDYFVVFSDRTAGNAYDLNDTDSDADDPGAAADWSLADDSRSQVNSNGWDTVAGKLQIAVRGAVNGVQMVTIAAAEPRVNYLEGPLAASAATFMVTRTSATTMTGATTDDALTVPVTLTQTGGSFLDGSTGEALSRTVTIPVGALSMDLVIPRDDLRLPDDEPVANGTLTATVQSGSGYEVGADASASVEIVPFMTVRIEQPSYTVAEEVGTFEGVTLIARTGDGVAKPTAAVTVVVATKNGTATTAQDYTGFMRAVTFAVADFTADGDAWRAEKPVSVMIQDNTEYEGDEMFEIELEELAPGLAPGILLVNADGAMPGDQSVTVTINDIADASTDATLSALSVNDGTTVHPIDLASPPYALNVGNAVDEVTLTATLTDDGAAVSTVTLDENDIADSDFSDGITVPSLVEGANEIVLTVTAEGGSDTQDYTLTVTRNAPATIAVDPDTGQPLKLITGASNPPQVGDILMVNHTAIVDLDGMTKADNGDAGYAYSYQWFHATTGPGNRALDPDVGTAITGATSATYTLVAADVGEMVGVAVSFTDDAGNMEGPLTSAATGAVIAAPPPDRTAPVAAWLPRFGRTVSEQVVEAAQARMAATPAPGLAGQLAGQTIAIAPGRGSAEARAAAEVGFAALGESFFGAGNATGNAWDDTGDDIGDGAAERGYSSRALTGRDFLTGSAFALTGHSGDSAATLWGRGAVTSFDGRDGSLSLDGEVVSGMLGIDWRNGERSGGLMLSRSRGEGDYRSSAAGGATSDDGRISATLTGLYPWLGHRVNDRLTLWGVAGYGRGTLTLTPAGEDALSAGIGLTMGSVGARGALGAGAEGTVLAWEADALALRTTSDAASGVAGRLDATSSGVTRLRLGLTGSRRFRLGSGAALTPGLEVGLRHDGGDAETGFGADIGVSLDFADPARGITAALSARGLLDHAAQGFRERGLSASLTWDQRPGSDLGWSLSLGHGVGAATEGGAASLLARQTLEGLAGDAGAEGGLQRRFDATLGYGVPMAAGRFVAISGIGFGLTDTGREYSVGWRLGLARSGPMDLHLRLEATRQESTTGSPTHDLGLDLGAAIRW